MGGGYAEVTRRDSPLRTLISGGPVNYLHYPRQPGAYEIDKISVVSTEFTLKIDGRPGPTAHFAKWSVQRVHYFGCTRRRYLRRMEFIVVSHELELPRESYSFDLDYPDNGNDNMTFSGTKVTTVENTK